jgi:hypothetical protein
MFRIHPELRRHVAIVVAASTVLGLIAGSLVVGLARGAPEVTEIPSPLVAVFVLSAFLVAYLGLFVTPRWYGEASRLVATTVPTRASVRLALFNDGDSASLTALVDLPDGRTENIALVPPRWDVRPLLGADVPAQVYIHPDSSEIVAVAVDRGRLWRLPPGRRVLSFR